MARGGWLLALVVAAAVASCTSSTPTCAAGEVNCGSCTNLQTDIFNCGACGTSCNAGSICVAGACTCTAPANRVCSGQCIDDQTDAANCGGCGNACGVGTCSAGACVCTPPNPPIMPCPNLPYVPTCVNTSSDTRNCGACGNACLTGETCDSALVPVCQCVAPKQLCPSGSMQVCTDTDTDPRNCGACGTRCPTGQICSGSVCQPVCTGDLRLCSGACVDTTSDPTNCGTCGNACGAGRSCVNSTCQAACTTLTCGGTCCQAPLGNTCCGTTACPILHQNFPGTVQEQTYFNCTPSEYNVVTAQVAASVWAPPSDGGRLINSNFTCPNTGGSICLVWQRDAVIGTNRACGVFCWFGPYAGAATTNQGTACLCPTQQRIDWF
ncbi:MAG: hypothetical protein WCS72_02815 [Deltaproteobacteria bacterium]